VFRLALIALVAFAFVPESVVTGKMPAGGEMPFCERNPHTCAMPGEVWDGLKRKAVVFGGAAIAAFRQQQSQDSSQNVAAGVQPSEPLAPSNPVRQQTLADTHSAGTLRREDLEPSWRGDDPQ